MDSGKTWDEEERLKALYEYGILDSTPDYDYDSILDLAVQITKAPVAYISFIDRNRQWFKSKHGFEDEYTTRTGSTCDITIKLGSEFVEVEDLRKDPVYNQGNLMALDRGLVFYASQVIYGIGGFPIGTLCVMDVVPRRLSEEQVKAMKALGRQTNRLLEFRRQKFDFNEKLMVARSNKLDLEEIVYLTSHDFRSPLVNISSLVSLIESKKDLSPAKLSMLLEKVKISSDGLLELIEGMVRYHEASWDHSTRYVDLNLVKLVQEIGAEYSDRIALQLKFDLDHESLILPKEVLARTFHELFHNAIRYSSKNRELQITLTHREIDKYHVFQFQDNGLGLPPEVKNPTIKLFESYHDKDRFGKKGNATGLVTIQRLIRGVGGAIEFQRNPGFQPGIGLVISIPNRKRQVMTIFKMDHDD